MAWRATEFSPERRQQREVQFLTILRGHVEELRQAGDPATLRAAAESLDAMAEEGLPLPADLLAFANAHRPAAS